MLGFIGRKGRVAEAREALRAAIARNEGTPAQLAAIAGLADRDREIHEVSVRLLQAGNSDRVLKLFDAIAPSEGRGSLFGWLWGTSSTRPAGSASSVTPERPRFQELSTSERMALLVDAIGQAIDDIAAREPFHTTHFEARWRFVVDGHPYEIEVDDDGDAELRLRHLNRRGYFVIRKGDASLPRADAGAWGDPLDLVQAPLADDRWLVARRCFLQDDTATWRELPAAPRQAIDEALATGRLTQLHVNSPVIEAHARLDPDDARPVDAQVRAILELLNVVAAAMGEGDTLRPPRSSTVMGGQLVTPPAELIVCAHCDTEHYRTEDPRCPACGAPQRRG